MATQLWTPPAPSWGHRTLSHQPIATAVPTYVLFLHFFIIFHKGQFRLSLSTADCNLRHIVVHSSRTSVDFLISDVQTFCILSSNRY